MRSVYRLTPVCQWIRLTSVASVPNDTFINYTEGRAGFSTTVELFACHEWQITCNNFSMVCILCRLCSKSACCWWWLLLGWCRDYVLSLVALNVNPSIKSRDNSIRHTIRKMPAPKRSNIRGGVIPLTPSSQTFSTSLYFRNLIEVEIRSVERGICPIAESTMTELFIVLGSNLLQVTKLPVTSYFC